MSKLQSWKTMNSAVLSLGLMGLMSVVSWAQEANRDGPQQDYQSFKNLVYSQVGDRRLRLDLYVPKQEQSPSLIVWIHGGAWRHGSKRLSPRRVQEVIEQGYALATVEYRLSQDAIFPAQIHDCKAAIRWLRAHANEYGFDATRIGVWGASAGGHLVSLLGTSADVAALEGEGGSTEQSSRVQAVCNWFGPTDFLLMNRQAPAGSRLDHDAADSPESQLIGAPIQDNPEKSQRANPVTYVTADDAPFLHMHGDRDLLVPFPQSELLHQALTQAGVASRLYRIEGGGHGGPQFESPQARRAIWEFFDLHLRP